MPKKYRNEGVSTLIIGGTRIEPGTEFEANLSDEYETQMIAGGHLAILKDRSVKEDRELADANPEDDE
jgi:hypothetical protein